MISSWRFDQRGLLFLFGMGLLWAVLVSFEAGYSGSTFSTFIVSIPALSMTLTATSLLLGWSKGVVRSGSRWWLSLVFLAFPPSFHMDFRELPYRVAF